MGKRESPKSLRVVLRTEQELHWMSDGDSWFISPFTRFRPSIDINKEQILREGRREECRTGKGYREEKGVLKGDKKVDER